MTQKTLDSEVSVLQDTGSSSWMTKPELRKDTNYCGQQRDSFGVEPDQNAVLV
jgi:hypothetical protein